MKKLLLLACLLSVTSAFAVQEPTALKGRDLCILQIMNTVAVDDGVDAKAIRTDITETLVRRFTLSRVKFSLTPVSGCLAMSVYASATKSKAGITLYLVQLEAVEAYQPDNAPKDSAFVLRSLWSTSAWGTGQSEAATVLPEQTKALAEVFLLDYISQNP